MNRAPSKLDAGRQSRLSLPLGVTSGSSLILGVTSF